MITKRLDECLQLALTGIPNAEIAERMSISENTVKNHLILIYRHFGVTSRPLLMDYVRRHYPSRMPVSR